MLDALRLPSNQLALWSLFVWGVRLKNADGSIGATLLSIGFLALAAAVLRFQRNGFLIVTLAGLTILVWLLRIVDIVFLSDHGAGFKVVHVVLGLVSMALAARTDDELNGKLVPRTGRRRARA